MVRHQETTETSEDRNHRLKLIRDLTFELIPLKSLDDAIAALPPRSEVSITCSPAKGIEATMVATNRIRAEGHRVVPHISARMVEGSEHLKQIAHWLRSEQIGTMFAVGGDANPPLGPYTNATDFLRDLLHEQPGLHTIGVPSYPDGHSAVSQDLLDQVLLGKQELLAEAGIVGYTSTQMCFNPDRIVQWLEAKRAGGLTLPLHLGMAGVVDRAKLMTMGARLGIGTSISYLRKNRRALGRLMTTAHYDPNDLLVPLSPYLARLDVTGIHCFTFNQVETTVAWRQSTLNPS